MHSTAVEGGFTPTRPSENALDTLTEIVESDRKPGVRYMLGIAGSPASGKTTLAKALTKRINHRSPGTAVHLPMDGFHLANSTLERLGLRDRKGSIETFDGRGFVALLDRVRTETDHVVYAPSFARRIDEGVAGEIGIGPEASIVVVEGNYLLANVAPWNTVRDRLDAVWFCRTPDQEREARLIDRHTRRGRSPEDAAAWVRDVDNVNAKFIEESRGLADLFVSGLTGEVITT